MKKTFIIIAIASVAGFAFAAPTVTFEAVLDIAQQLGVFNFTAHPALERIETNEAENIKGIALDMFNIQMHTEPQSRDAHAKAHGCAVAEVKIENSIPTEYQVGTFAEPGKTFGAIIRYSNGSSKTQSDAIADAKGMAIKIIGAVPEGNLLGTGTTQDLMLIDSPRFFLGSIADYLLFQDTIIKAGKADGFFLNRAIREAIREAGIAGAETIPQNTIDQIAAGVMALPNPAALQKAIFQNFSLTDAAQLSLKLPLKLFALKNGKAPRELVIVKELSHPVGSVLTESYFSMSSYLLKAKSGDTAVKYATHPIDCTTGADLKSADLPEKPSDDYFKGDLQQRLASGPACFRLTIQPLPAGSAGDLQTLVEDSRLDFNTQEITVAKITIEQQTLGSDAKRAYCDNLSFNPWQTSATHQPLGSMNRARKVAVTASSIRRHLVTGAQRAEPASVDAYRNLP